MSSRLASGRLSHYYISLEPAHAIVVQACLSVLLQLDSHINKGNIEKYPLAVYAAQHWVDHAKFQNVTSLAEHAMKHIFDRDRPHFAAWVWLYDADRESRRSMGSDIPLQPNASPIYYAALWDLPGIAEWLVTACSQDVNEHGGYYGTPLCAAAARGCLRAAQVLVKFGAHVDAAVGNGWSPLLWASDSGCLELSRLVLDLGADINHRDSSSRTPLSSASGKGHQEVAMLLLQQGADANIWERGEGTALMKALQREDLVFAQRLLSYGADVNVRNDDGTSLLHLALRHRNMLAVQWLIEHGATSLARNTQGGKPPEGCRRIMGLFPNPLHFRFVSFWSPCVVELAKHVHLPDDEGVTPGAIVRPKTKRRALLVGISYYESQSATWFPLDGPHDNVDRFSQLLLDTYGYAPGDITVLRDDPNLPDNSQPTLINIISELMILVDDAAPGDKFTFFYSGHGDDKQKSLNDEEDGQGKAIITSDLQRVVDKELKNILVDPLPVGCSLLTIFDASHSATMLDLPHSHCNSIYVPWLSKGKRCTLTLRNMNVRKNALQFPHYPDPLPLSKGGMTVSNGGHWSSSPLSRTQLRIDTQLGGRTDDGRTIQCTMSVEEPEAYPTSPVLCDSPLQWVLCDGWCQYNTIAHPTVISLSACSDLQRAWDGPNGSLSTVLCKYLRRHPRPSFRNLMSRINFMLHENGLALHKYTRYRKMKEKRGEGSSFDGELNDFQEPTLSSLAKLNMDDTFDLV